MAASREKMEDILDNIRGYLFLGTPHSGSRLASASLLWWFEHGNEIDIRSILSVGSQYLAELDFNFRALEQVKSCSRIYNFYETQPMHYGPAFFPLVMKVGTISHFLYSSL